MHHEMGISNTDLKSFLYGKAVDRRIPLSGIFELSPVCNFACRMCYVRKTQADVEQNPRPIMRLEDWLRIAGEAKNQGLLYLLLTGGEPFLWPDFWNLYDELIDMGFLITINTNGSLIDSKVIEHLIKKPPLKINITLYGASDETYQQLCAAKGMYQRVVNAIERLRTAGILVKLNGSFTPYNVADMESVCSFAKDHELVFEGTTYMFPPMRRDSSMVGENDRFTPAESAIYDSELFRLQYGEKAFSRRMEGILNGVIPPPSIDESCIDPVNGKIWCRAGKASFWITWDGYMTPCGMMTEPRTDIKQQSFADAWKATCEATDRITLSGVCQSCVNQKLCHVCAAKAYAETGRFDGIPKYFCDVSVEMKKYAERILKQKNN